ncbi:hypothetical protein ABZ892_13515 [Streptomyces sp. NPDC046924]|uniref:hypothetical protein n=1 Tax=Streptomyces sp. NPDC046924 TaxID=3155136 RepID=UPI0033D1F727
MSDQDVRGALGRSLWGRTAFQTSRFGHCAERGRGSRLLLTRALWRGAEPVWEEQARAAGLIVEHVDERPDEPEMWGRLYRQWISHADELRRDLGDVQAERMLGEAHRILPAPRPPRGPSHCSALAVLVEPCQPGRYVVDEPGEEPGEVVPVLW